MKKLFSLLIIILLCVQVTAVCAAKITILGDVNNDISVDAKDALAFKKHLAKIMVLSDSGVINADINADKKINISDLLALKKHLAKIETISNGNKYFVSKSGNDDGDGSLEEPFKTIQKAADVMQAGDCCYIMQGVYNETVIPKNSGNKGLPITFCAYENDSVTVSGAQSVSTDWSYYRDGIYKTNVKLWRGDENQIFVDGKMATLCRYPNKDADDFLSVGSTLKAKNASENFVESAEAFQEAELSGAKIAVMGTNDYLFWSSTVTANSENLINFKSLNSGWDSPCANSKFYLYDKLELLDSENEWYYDDESQTLYYKPKSGAEMNNLSVEYSARGQAFDVSGKSNITIKGLTLFGAGIRNNSSSENLCIDSNKILYYYHSNISRSYPWEADWWGVELHGDGSAVINNEIAYGAEAGVVVYADNCFVVNNYIHDINYNVSNAAAIEPRRGEYTLISHNTIKNTSRSAIVANSKNTRICYNDISACGINASDVSGIGSYKFDAQSSVEIDHNVIHDCKNGKMFVAYYLDNGSLNYLVHHNVAYNVDFAMTLNNPSYNNKIYNNTFVKCGAISTGNLQNPFDNNAFIGSVWTGDEFYNNILPSIYYGDGAYFSNNLFNADKSIGFADYDNNDFSLIENSKAANGGTGTAIDNSCSYIGAYDENGKFSVGANFNQRYECALSFSEANTQFEPKNGAVYEQIKSANGENLLDKSIFYDNLKINKGWAEQTISVKPGDIYYYTCDAEFERSIDNTYLEFGVHFLDGSGNITSQGGFLFTQNARKKLETIFVVPENCFKMRCFAACWADETAIAGSFSLIKIN